MPSRMKDALPSDIPSVFSVLNYCSLLSGSRISHALGISHASLLYVCLCDYQEVEQAVHRAQVDWG